MYRIKIDARSPSLCSLSPLTPMRQLPVPAMPSASKQQWGHIRCTCTGIIHIYYALTGTSIVYICVLLAEQPVTFYPNATVAEFGDAIGELAMVQGIFARSLTHMLMGIPPNSMCIQNISMYDALM